MAQGGSSRLFPFPLAWRPGLLIYASRRDHTALPHCAAGSRVDSQV